MKNQWYHSVSIGNEQLGEMRQKIAIFKEDNSVWWGPKFLRAFKNLMGGDVDENRHLIEGK